MAVTVRPPKNGQANQLSTWQVNQSMIWIRKVLDGKFHKVILVLSSLSPLTLPEAYWQKRLKRQHNVTWTCNAHFGLLRDTPGVQVRQVRLQMG